MKRSEAIEKCIEWASREEISIYPITRQWEMCFDFLEKEIRMIPPSITEGMFVARVNQWEQE